MKVLDSLTKAYRLNGNAISDESLDAVINAAYAMLANNDEIVPPFEEWDEEEIILEDDNILSYFTRTDSGKEIRIVFSLKEISAKILLLSGEEEYFIGDDLLCIIRAGKRYLIDEWL